MDGVDNNMSQSIAIVNNGQLFQEKSSKCRLLERQTNPNNDWYCPWVVSRFYLPPPPRANVPWASKQWSICYRSRAQTPPRSRCSRPLGEWLCVHVQLDFSRHSSSMNQAANGTLALRRDERQNPDMTRGQYRRLLDPISCSIDETSKASTERVSLNKS